MNSSTLNSAWRIIPLRVPFAKVLWHISGNPRDPVACRYIAVIDRLKGKDASDIRVITMMHCKSQATSVALSS
jgi:hypothetical protein